jgi:putative addiction module antidote
MLRLVLAQTHAGVIPSEARNLLFRGYDRAAPLALLDDCCYNCYNSERSHMLELKIRKIGNSLGVVLPKEAVSRLQAGEGDRLFLIEGPNGAYQLTPYDPAFEKKMKQAEDIISRYRNTLHTLSK